MPAAVAALVVITSLALVAAPAIAVPAPGTITTWAGGTGEGPATTLAVRPDELAVRGPLVYIADQRHHLVRVLDTRTGELRTVAGNGDQNIYLSQTPLGDGGSASATRIDTLTGVAVDSSGRVYFSDAEDDRIRRVDGSGIVTTVAGGGHPPDGDADGDGLPATQATLHDVASLAFDPAGNLFAADLGGQRVRRIQTSGIIGKVAGGRCCSTVNPDGALAIGADIHVKAVAVDATGHLYLANGQHVFMLDDAGILIRVAGASVPVAELGDGGPATEARLKQTEALAFDDAGNLYIADSVDNRVRMVDPAGTITTVAGGGTPSNGLGDGAAATAASLSNPSGLVVGPDGDLYVSDTDHLRLRKVSGGVITTVAGNGTLHTGGDGGPAAMAQFGWTEGTVRDAAGNLYMADSEEHRVRRIDPSGRITTVAGTTWGFSGDGGPAVAAQLHHPVAVAVDPAGNLFISDSENDRVRRVDTAGIITTVAGGGAVGLGDGGSATGVALQRPQGLAVDGGGGLYVAERGSARVRRVTPAGTISTFAGGGTTSAGDGDGGPATSAVLSLQASVYLAFDRLGQLHISEEAGWRVRKVDLAGVITTVAGIGRSSNGYGPTEGVLATRAVLNSPGAIGFDGGGNLYVSGKAQMNMIMKVDLMGRIHHVGGNGSTRTELGDGGPAVNARIISGGTGLTFDQAGNLYVAGENRIRRIEAVALTTGVVSTGFNGIGQLGDGTTVDRHSVVAAPGLADVRAVGAGYYHSLAVRADGTVWAWGWNRFGQLGDGTTTDRSQPTQVIGLTDVIAVAGGGYNSLALRADGTVWAWGWNAVGQVGDGTTTDRPVPVQVPELTGVSAIAAGGFHNLALTHAGAVWAWGWNWYGQLGIGSPSAMETRPVPVPGSAGATAIAAGLAHSLSVRMSEGNPRIYSWGFNGLGQLGDGTTVDRPAPVRSLAFGEDVFAGGYHSFTSTEAWGYNNFGQLGSGSSAAYLPTPTLIVKPEVRFDTVAGGLFHNVALATDGSVFSWGWNGYGALGDGTTTARTVPTVIGGVTGAGAVAVGAVHSVVVR